jgi:hypothetical protein
MTNSMTSSKSGMKIGILLLSVILVTLFGSTVAHAQITPLGDSYTNTADTTANYGSKTLLDVDGATQITYIQFPLSSIPSGASVSQATLKLYVNGVTTAGSFNVDYVNGAWAESTIDASNAPALGTTIASNVDVTTADKNQYILINVTSAVQAWLSGSETNDGFALVANSTFNATFDSKENTATSHPAELDIAYAGAITGVTTVSGSGLSGGGTSGTLNLSLTSACATSQVLQWNGTAWACETMSGTGTVTSVASGLGLTGGPITGSGTLAINPSVVPQLSAANTFTGNQTVNGNLSATGVVTGTGFQIGSNLFDYGSYANGNAFLGFAGNTTTTGTSNTASGFDALYSNTTGFANTASGFDALYSNTTGVYNMASGDYALYSNTTGGANTACGHQALLSNTTGTSNTASGYDALLSNTTGTSNTASGYAALFGNSTGGSNTASGFEALSSNTTGGANTASGASALYFNTTGANNTASGASALYYNTTGANNTASGYEALNLNTTGTNNTASGFEALSSNTTGPYNTATGYEALYSNTAANYNTATGAQALFNNTGEANLADGALALYSNLTGAGNTAVGANACYSNTTSNYLTCFGYSSSSSDGISNATAIGARARVEQSNSLVLGAIGINVGIGTTKPSNILTIGRGAGHPVSDSWETYSSRRWKTNIQTLPDALSKVEQLRGVSYDLKDSGKHEIGVIAEEVGAVVPEVVTYEDNGKDARGVDYSRLTALLIEAAKEQQRAVKQQQALARKQQAQIRALQAQLKAQQAKGKLQDTQMAELMSQLKAIQLSVNQVSVNQVSLNQASLETNGHSGTEVRTAKANVPHVPTGSSK